MLNQGYFHYKENGLYKTIIYKFKGGLIRPPLNL